MTVESTPWCRSSIAALWRLFRFRNNRHTFAVRLLEHATATDRDSANRHMLTLATYLGHNSVSSTYWYLEATPVLLRHIAREAEHAHARRVPS